MKAEEIVATLSAPDREGLASNVRNWMRALGILEASPDPHAAQSAGDIEDPVMVPRGLLGAACAAISSKRDAPKTLDELRWYTVGGCSSPRGESLMNAREEQVDAVDAIFFSSDALYVPEDRKMLEEHVHRWMRALGIQEAEADPHAAKWGMLVDACEKINASAEVTDEHRRLLCASLDKFSAVLMGEDLQPKCVITGCAVVRDGQWAAADLFEIGEFWLVNVCYTDEGVAWNSLQHQPPHYSNIITIIEGCLFWERRAVFVVHKSCAVLNQAAIDYMA